MVQPFSKTFWQFLTNLNIVLSYDPEIIPLGLYPTNYKTYKHQNLYMNAYSSFIWNHPNYNSQDVNQEKKVQINCGITRNDLAMKRHGDTLTI